MERKAQYGSKGLKEALTGLLSQAKKAQSFIENQGKAEIRKVSKEFIQDMSELIDQYSNHVVSEVSILSLFLFISLSLSSSNRFFRFLSFLIFLSYHLLIFVSILFHYLFFSFFFFSLISLSLSLLLFLFLSLSLSQ